tara:strand:- start:17 stop:616 length:600 start_codon:yes stop_codon:yes gene_type:complete
MLNIKILIVYIIIICTNFTICHSKEIETILNYFEKFQSLSADFIQINNNGDILSGKILLKKPGKIRIEYNETPLLIISNGKQLATINKKLKTIGFFSIEELPVKLLLYDKIDKSMIKLVDVEELDNILRIRIRESSSTNQGELEITFEKKPFRIAKWSVFNINQTKTEILLSKLRFNSPIENSVFDLDKEDPRIPFWKN